MKREVCNEVTGETEGEVNQDVWLLGSLKNFTVTWLKRTDLGTDWADKLTALVRLKRSQSEQARESQVGGWAYVQ